MEATTRLDLFTLVLISGVLPGIMLSFLLIASRNKNKSLKPLGWLILVLTLSLIEVGLNYSGLITSVIHLYNFSESLQLLIGPLIFLHFKSLSGKNIRPVDWLHFLPFLLLTAYLSIEFTGSAEQKFNNYINSYELDPQYLFVENYSDPDPWNIRAFVTTTFLYLQLLSYLLLSYFVIRGSSNPVTQKISSWNKFLIFMAIVGSAVLLISKYFADQSVGENLVGAFLTIFIYSTAYLIAAESTWLRSSKKKYKGSALSPEVTKNKLHDLKELMEKDKVYIQNDISLSILSEKLKLSEHHVSQLINDQLNTNFYGLVKMYRIDEAKKLLQQKEHHHLNIEEIGYQVGFNSKSAFFSSFKKSQGETPLSYRNRFE